MLYDLTMPISERTPNFPDDPAIVIRQVSTIEADGYNKKLITLHSHCSTHIDAPLHMIAGGKSLADLPIEAFIGEGVVLDVRGQQEIETNLSQVLEGDIVFFCTSHTDKAGLPDFFTGNPVLTVPMAQALIDRKVKIVGLDSFTSDNEPYTIHKMLLGQEILIVENLVGLLPLAGIRFKCTILPLKIQNADGAPCRVIAEV